MCPCKRKFREFKSRLRRGYQLAEITRFPKNESHKNALSGLEHAVVHCFAGTNIRVHFVPTNYNDVFTKRI